MLNCGKREENMKIKMYYFIFIVATGLFCSSVTSQVELSGPSKEPLLISQSHPAFPEIDMLHVVVLLYGSKQDKDEQFYKQLEKDVKEKLRLAGLKLETPTADNILSVPELRIYISTLGLDGSQQYVLHILTALARAVCLKNEQNPVFKSDIWQTTPVMQAVSAENIPVKVNDLVLEQVEGFINIYRATNLTGEQLSDVNINETDSSAIPDKQVDTAEHKYVASKSSTIFHKPECRWAGNISQRNLVTYKSKDEAIKAGKRPCKTCNP
jgi:hypothetical protein